MCTTEQCTLHSPVWYCKRSVSELITNISLKSKTWYIWLLFSHCGHGCFWYSSFHVFLAVDQLNHVGENFVKIRFLFFFLWLHRSWKVLIVQRAFVLSLFFFLFFTGATRSARRSIRANSRSSSFFFLLSSFFFLLSSF